MTTITTIPYTGFPTTFTIPPEITQIQVTAVGGGGLSRLVGGGRGGKVISTLTVSPGLVLDINVGGGGQYYDGVRLYTPGYNGGAERGGGGMTTVKYSNSILIVAGGGGAGDSSNYAGGNAGGIGPIVQVNNNYIGVGVAGLRGTSSSNAGGFGGFITGGNGMGGGAAGLSYIAGGNGGNSASLRYGGGGGGYGGGGGGGPTRSGGGGGGSFSTDINSTFSLGDVSAIADGTGLNGYVEILYVIPPPPCFLVGSKILTDQGYKAIETLRKGDFIKTSLDGYKPIVLLGKSELNHPALFEDRIKHQLYVCSPAAYPELSTDLVLTGCHCILVDEFTSPVQKEKTYAVNNEIYITDTKYRLPACVDERTTVYPVEGKYTIYHLALENEQYTWNYGIYANGLLVESCSERYLSEMSSMTFLD